MADVSIDLTSLTDEDLRSLEDGLIHLEENLAAAGVVLSRLRRATQEAAASHRGKHPAGSFVLVLDLDPDAPPESARHLASVAGWFASDLLGDPTTPAPLRMVAEAILRGVGQAAVGDATSHELLRRPAADDIPPAER